MTCSLLHSVITAEWAAADRELGTSFPVEWRQDGWSWLRPRLDQAERDSRMLEWSTRLARESDRAGELGAVVAEVGFHGPPDAEGWVEIGYRVVAARRRTGLAEEAVTALLDWARARGAVGVRASTSADNAASLSLLRKLGFCGTETRDHPALGEQRVLRLPLVE